MVLTRHAEASAQMLVGPSGAYRESHMPPCVRESNGAPGDNHAAKLPALIGASGEHEAVVFYSETLAQTYRSSIRMRAIMSELVGILLAVVAASAVIAALAGCGGDTASTASNSVADTTSTANTTETHTASATVASLPGDAVAQVGDATISKATLNHWMSTMVGGDFAEDSTVTAPQGLVSDPPTMPLA